MTMSADFNTIILLTGRIEAAALSGVLGVRNPLLDIRHVETQDDLDAIGRTVLARARLISFMTDLIVPPSILDALGYGAYNFHPGPPTYPGWGPAHFAVYDRAELFGVTAHEMIARVDAGTIVDAIMFPVAPGTPVPGLEQMAFVALAQMFSNLAPKLTGPEPLAALPIEWRGPKRTQRQYRELQNVPATIAKDDLDRRVAAFGPAYIGDGLTITLFGHQFRYVAPAAETPAEAPTETPQVIPLVRPAQRPSVPTAKRPAARKVTAT
jgi:hypothetical protein